MTQEQDNEPEARLREVTRKSRELLRKGLTEAVEVAERGIELATELGDREALGWNLYVAGAGRVNVAAYEAAESDLRRALMIGEEIGDRRLRVEVLRSMLKRAYFVRDYEGALVSGMEALELARDLEDEGCEALVRNDLAIIYGNVGGLEEALEHLLAGLRLLQRDGSERLASHLNNVGNVYFELGDFEQARDFFTSALQEFRKQEAWRGEAIALGNIGRARNGMGQREEAVEDLRQSLAILEEHGDIAYRASAASRLASVLAAMGREDDARLTFARALEHLLRSPHREFEDEVFASLGRYHLDRGSFAKAITWLSRALAGLPTDEASSRVHELHLALSSAYEGLGDAQTALHHFREHHRISQLAAGRAAAIRLRGLMFQFDVEQARQREEIFRLRSIELVEANQELQALKAELEQSNAELRRLSAEDPLTGLSNRRQLDHRLGIEIDRAKRHERSLCAVMCDLDHFKQINDRFSHGVGDEVLRRVAAVLRGLARASDIIARYGGEEFLLILPETDIEGAVAFSERVRERIANHSWHELADDLRVTASIGIGLLAPDEDAASLILAADRNLYEAKRSGRDRIVHPSESTSA